MHVMVETVTQSQQSNFLPSWLPTPNKFRQAAAVREMDAILAEIIGQRRHASTDRGDLLSMLMLARDEGEQGMSDQQLRDEVMTLFIAGHETTAVALTWAFYLLSQHPHIEARLHEELDQELRGRLPTVADLARLTYTAQVIKETMRLCPPVPLIPREVLNDTVIRGYQIPKGTPVIFASYIAHRNPTYFEEPETFQPERWTAAFEKQLPRYAYFPFGGGPRVCIGNSFAMMETQLILATVAQRYRLRPQPNQTVQPASFISLRPANGVWMTLEQRSS
jgi:cytochrome P450